MRKYEYFWLQLYIDYQNVIKTKKSEKKTSVLGVNGYLFIYNIYY